MMDSVFVIESWPDPPEGQPQQAGTTAMLLDGQLSKGGCPICAQRLRYKGFRFSLKAVMPSRRSSTANVEYIRRRSR